MQPLIYDSGIECIWLNENTFICNFFSFTFLYSIDQMLLNSKILFQKVSTYLNTYKRKLTCIDKHSNNLEKIFL